MGDTMKYILLIALFACVAFAARPYCINLSCQPDGEAFIPITLSIDIIGTRTRQLNRLGNGRNELLTVHSDTYIGVLNELGSGYRLLFLSLSTILNPDLTSSLCTESLTSQLTSSTKTL